MALGLAQISRVERGGPARPAQRANSSSIDVFEPEARIGRLSGASVTAANDAGLPILAAWPAQPSPIAPVASSNDVSGASPDSSSAAPPVVAADNADLLLVQRSLAGDMRAFELLVLKYERRIHRLIGRFIRDDGLVEDLAQETFIRAYRALGQWRGDAQFYTWLYRIAVNTAKKQLIDLKRDPVLTESAMRSRSDEDDEPRLPDTDTNGETPETLLASRQIADAIQEAMAALPDELRQAIALREIEGLTYEEISEAMSCPIGTVRSRIFRAREAISARIKPMLDKQTTKRW